MDPLTIRSRLGDYGVEFRDDADWAVELCELENAFVVVDENVWRLHGEGCLAPLATRPLHLVSATEETKTLDGIAALCDGMIAQAAKRNAVIVSIGGGIVQDVTVSSLRSSTAAWAGYTCPPPCWRRRTAASAPRRR